MTANGTEPATSHATTAAGFDTNSIGEALLKLLNYKSFGIAATALLIAMLIYRLTKRRPVRLAHCLKLVEGALGLYLGVTIWAVFALTDPPAIHTIGHEMLPYVGLVTLLVMCSFALPALKVAFTLDEKQQSSSPTPNPPGAE